MKAERITALTHYIGGAVSGAAVASFEGVYFVPVVLLALIAKSTEMVVGEKKGAKWWMTNGFPVFLFSFISIWVLVYNLG